MIRARRGASRIWRWPIVLAALILFGLFAALLGQGGVWWPLSWIALGIPLIVIAALIRPGRKHPSLHDVGRKAHFSD
jgi:dolichyl-phosphate-mannose--protein O-mannosyl transferase